MAARTSVVTLRKTTSDDDSVLVTNARRLATMKKFYCLCALSFFLAGPPVAFASHESWEAKFDCERATVDADLILVARVEEVSKIVLVRGGKGESSIYQYEFKPLRVIKGVFARDKLVLSSGDLALERFSGGYGLKPLAKGETRLLFLGRSSEGYQNAVQNDQTLEVALPLVRDEHDPLLGAIETLLAVNAEPNRARRVDRLIEALRVTDGPAVVPLCFALERRAILAAQNPAAPAALARHLRGDAGPVAQDAAARTLGKMMDVDYLRRTDLRASVAKAAAALLDDKALPAPVRATLTGLLGEAGAETIDHLPAALAQLHVDPPAETRLEQTARVSMIGWLRLASQRQAVGDAFGRLPLDEDSDREFDFAKAFARIDPERAAHDIPERIKLVLATQAGEVATLIEALQELPAKLATNALLQIFPLALDSNERNVWVATCAKICELAPDERFIEPLNQCLAQRNDQLGWYAVDALMRIGSLRAAEVLRPHLPEELYLSRKLLVAEFLGKHGFHDGYPYAIEHLSETYLTDQAIAALVAIKDPDAIVRLQSILASSNDLAWRSAAVRALGALQAKDQAAQFLAWASDLTIPLAPAALIALADLGDTRVVPKVREGLSSRNDTIVEASATAAGKLLAHGDLAANDLGDVLAGLLADPQADQTSRTNALEGLYTAKDSRLDRALAAAEMDAKLEKSPLITRVETLLRERKIAVLP